MEENKEIHKSIVQQDKEDGITIKRSTLWKAMTFLFAVLFITSIFTGGFGRGDNTTGDVTVPSIEPSQPSTTQQPSIPRGIAAVNAESLVDDDSFLGDENAPLTIIEFSDFQCPFCRRFYINTLPSLKSEYIDTGKVKMVYRDFPLSFHPGAQSAAEGAECAKDQGKFWDMHDKIFEEQSKQGQGTIQFGAEDVRTWASEIGLNMGEFNTCFDSGKYTSEVQKDFSDGSAAGVTGTPGFIVGNQPLTGAQPFSSFKAVIDSQL